VESDFETRVSDSTLIEALWFRHKTSRIKVFQHSNSLVVKYGGVVNSHATNNLAISEKKKRIKTESLSQVYLGSSGIIL